MCYKIIFHRSPGTLSTSQTLSSPPHIRKGAGKVDSRQLITGVAWKEVTANHLISPALTCFFQPEPVVAAAEPPPVPEPEPVLPSEPEAVAALEPEPVPAQLEVLRHVACLACLYTASWGSQSSSYHSSHSLSTHGLSFHLLSVYVLMHLPYLCSCLSSCRPEGLCLRRHEWYRRACLSDVGLRWTSLACSWLGPACNRAFGPGWWHPAGTANYAWRFIGRWTQPARRDRDSCVQGKKGREHRHVLLGLKSLLAVDEAGTQNEVIYLVPVALLMLHPRLSRDPSILVTETA